MDSNDDIVCKILSSPFNGWEIEDKMETLHRGRPTTSLKIVSRKEVRKAGKSYTVNFKSHWFDDFAWLCSSVTTQRLYCWPCLLFSVKNTVWNKEGFSDLLNVTRSLHIHEDSGEHIKCQLKLKSWDPKRSTIVDAVRENERLCRVHHNEKVRLNRLLLRVIIDAVLYLSKQELAFRVHEDVCDSKTGGNFKELVALLISKCPLEIQNHYENVKDVLNGDSETTQMDLVDCISEYLNDHVKNEITGCAFYSLQVDDVSHINHTSQCSIIIRYVDSSDVLVERFLGFHEVGPDRSSGTLYCVLDKILDRLRYESKLVAQCYDGAIATSEHLAMLQKKILHRAPQAVFVHSLAQPLNLVLQQSLSRISDYRMFFATISGMASFFQRYSKQTLTGIKGSWSYDLQLINEIVEDWSKLKDMFESIVNWEESDKKSAQLSKGFLSEMSDFHFVFLAVAINDIFSDTEVLFTVLREHSLDIDHCSNEIINVCDRLTHRRNDDYFSNVFQKAIEMSQTSPQTDDETHLKVIPKYRDKFYEILDHVKMEMNARFQNSENLQFIRLVDSYKFEDYNTNFPVDALEHLIEIYGNVFTKMQRLKNELGLLYADEAYWEQPVELIFVMIRENKEILTELYKLFTLILTIPSSNRATSDSPCMNRIKSYSRNAISQERLPSLANISIQKELVQDLVKTQPFHEDITKMFAALNRKLDLKYKD